MSLQPLSLQQIHQRPPFALRIKWKLVLWASRASHTGLQACAMFLVPGRHGACCSFCLGACSWAPDALGLVKAQPLFQFQFWGHFLRKLFPTLLPSGRTLVLYSCCKSILFLFSIYHHLNLHICHCNYLNNLVSPNTNRNIYWALTAYLAISKFYQCINIFNLKTEEVCPITALSKGLSNLLTTAQLVSIK